MPVKWTRPKKAAGDKRTTARAPVAKKPKGKGKKPADAKAKADKEAK